MQVPEDLPINRPAPTRLQVLRQVLTLNAVRWMKAKLFSARHSLGLQPVWAPGYLSLKPA